MIQNECNVEQLQKAIEEKELIKYDGMRKTKKQLKVSYFKLSNCSISKVENTKQLLARVGS